MTEWATIASLATAVGILVLAVAIFASVRSANYSARAADQAASIANDTWLTTTGRHFNVDRPDPR